MDPEIKPRALRPVLHLRTTSSSGHFSPSLVTQSNSDTDSQNSSIHETERRVSLHEELSRTSWLTPSLPRSKASTASKKSSQRGSEVSKSSGYLTPPETRIDVAEVPWKPCPTGRHVLIDQPPEHQVDQNQRRYSETCVELYKAYFLNPDEHTKVPFWLIPKGMPGALLGPDLSVSPSKSRRWRSVSVGDTDLHSTGIGTKYAARQMLERTRVWTKGLSNLGVVNMIGKMLAIDGTSLSTPERNTPAGSKLKTLIRIPKDADKIQSSLFGNLAEDTTSTYRSSRSLQGSFGVRTVAILIAKGEAVQDVSHLIRDISAMPHEFRSTNIKLPERRLSENATRRPSFTKQGLLPQPCLPPDQAIMIENIPRVSPKPELIITGTDDWDEGRRYSVSSQGSDANCFHRVHPTPMDGSEFDEDDFTLAPLLPKFSDAMSLFKSTIFPPKKDAATHETSEQQRYNYPSEDHRMFQWTWNSPDRNMLSTLASPESGSRTPNPPGPPQNTPNRPATPSSQWPLPEVISFPALIERHQTSDWISPLPDIDRPRCLYNAGIDAHTGPLGSRPTIPLVEIKSPNESAPTPHDAEDSPPTPVFQEPTSDPAPRRKSVILQHPKAQPRTSETLRMGASIGSSSGARRRSLAVSFPQTPQIVPHAGESKGMGSAIGSSSHMRRRSSAGAALGKPKQTTTEDKEDTPSAGDKQRRNSGWLKLTSTPPTSSTPERRLSSDAKVSFAEGVPERSDRTDRVRIKSCSKGRHRLSLIEELAPMLSKIDRAGIYGTMTGTSSELDMSGRLASIVGECDCEPHQCGDFPTRDRVMSVDWIG